MNRTLALAILAVFAVAVVWATLEAGDDADPRPAVPYSPVKRDAPPNATSPPSLPTLEPTPDIERMVDDALENHFRKLRQENPGGTYTCEKRVFWTQGTGVCLGRIDRPDGLRQISAWRFVYDVGGSGTGTELRSFAYSVTEPLGILMSCSGSVEDCRREVMPVAEGVREVEQTAARWNR